MNYTENQTKAIKARGKNVLVSASAGSGKTSVMIERIVQIITGQEAEVKEILATTFTRFAAEQLKAKLAKGLKKASKTNPELLKQLDQLPYASISTLHSFCNDLIKTYFYKLDVDANFKIIEEIDEQELKDKAMERVFARLYERNEQDFIDLLKKLLYKRSDKQFKEIILELYNYIVTEVNPDEYLQKSLFAYTEQGVARIAEKFLVEIKQELNALLKEIDQVVETLSLTEKQEDKLYSVALEIQSDLQKCLTQNSPSSLAQTVRDKKYNLTSGGAKESPQKKEQREKIKAIKGVISTVYKHIGDFFDGCAYMDEYKQTAKDFETLIKIVKEFQREYSKIKQDVMAVDFADLEQLTIKLLQDEQVCEDIKNKYKFILVDEFQDVNPAQEYIVKKISKDNLFLVGDVKQAIYGFRGSDSELFVKTEKEYQNSDKGITVQLKENFRSTKAVIDSVNKIFCGVMKSDSGVDYASSQMVYGANYPEDGEFNAIIYQAQKEEKIKCDGVYDIEKYAYNEQESEEHQEANAIIEIIKNILGTPYFDLETQTYKEIGFKDIVILSRGLGTDAEKMANCLAKKGVKVEINNKNVQVEYPEISMLTDVLKLVDNFNSDTALVSALKSPLGNFTDKELLQIKNKTKSTFVDSFLSYSTCGELLQKIEKFKNLYSVLRLTAQVGDASEVVAKLFTLCPLEALIGVRFMGEEKVKRTYKFMEMGKGYTVSEYVKRLKSGKISFVLPTESTDSVKIMTIHASKGLEFPVVILAQCGKAFNMRDLSNTLIFDREEGVAFAYYDSEKRIKYTVSPYREYLKYRLRKRLSREEMRLFYVATTRAKNKFYMVGKYKGFAEQIYDYQINYLNHYLDYVKNGDVNYFVQTEFESGQEIIKSNLVLDFKKSLQSQKIAKNLAFKYPYTQNVPIKSSVTELASDKNKIYLVNKEFGETSAEKGTAYHKFLELWDFEKDWQSFYQNQAKQQMVQADYQHIDPLVLEKICNMPLFKQLKDYTVYKEKEFIVGVPYNLLVDSESEQEVVVQGVMDLLAVGKDKAIIIDYKYSAIADEDLQKKYGKQLALYAYAVEKLLKKPTETHLINIYSQKIISLQGGSLKS